MRPVTASEMEKILKLLKQGIDHAGKSGQYPEKDIAFLKSMIKQFSSIHSENPNRPSTIGAIMHDMMLAGLSIHRRLERIKIEN